MRHTRTVAAVAAPTLAITALLTAAPALAKSDVAITVSARSIEAGHAVRVTGYGDNDAQGRRTQVCVQIRSHHQWRDLRCSRPTPNASMGVKVPVRVMRADPSVVRLRAQLYDFAPHSNRGAPDQTSQTVTVQFTA